MLHTRFRYRGVDKFVILPVAIKPEHVQSINNFAISEEKAHSEFYAFGTLHAAMNNPMLEIERISADVKGIKFHPDTQLFNADDDRLLPVFDAIQGRLPVLFHCGDTRFDYSHPKRIKRIIEMFPKLTVIAAHLGGWSMYETGYELLKNEDCYFDLSSSLMFLEKERAVRIIRSYGSDRVLFGTDFPLWSPAASFSASSGVTACEKKYTPTSIPAFSAPLTYSAKRSSSFS